MLPNGGLKYCCGRKSGHTSSPVALSFNTHERALLVADITNAVCDRINTGVAVKDRDVLVNDITDAVCKKMHVGLKDTIKEVFKDVFADLKEELRTELTGDIDDIRGGMKEVRETQEEINKNLETINKDVSAATELATKANAKIPEVFTNVTSEVEDRLARKSNVIVFGIPENAGGDTLSRKSKDGESLIQAFNELSFPVDLSHSTYFRLGKFSQRLARPRPLKVIFSSMSKASELLCAFSQRKKSLDGSSSLKQILILPDQTEAQRLSYRNLKLELEDRKIAENNPNFKILTRNGRQQIVSVIPRKSQQNPGLNQQNL